MRTPLSILFFSLIFVGGCIKIPTDEAACMMQPTPSLEKTEELASHSSAFEKGACLSACWWEMFEDPQLNALIETALQENPTLQRVQGRIEAAEAEAKIKKSRLFPQIGFSADVDWQYLGKYDFFRAYTPVIPANVTEYEIDLNFSYEFDFWGKNRNTYKAALGLARAEEAERESAILAITTSIATVYFKLQAHQEKLEILKKERAVLTRLFQLTEKRRENALDTTQQKISAQESLFVINQNIQLAKQKIALQYHMLNVLVGQGPECLEEIEKTTPYTSIRFPMPSQICSDLLARRPDLMAQIWRVEAAAYLVGAAKADFYPNIDLFGLAGFDSVFISKLFNWQTRTASIQPALHLPIFTAGRIKANLRAKQAEFEQTIAFYNELVLQAAREVADSAMVLKTAEENLKLEKMLVQSREENRKIVAMRYKNALDNLLDLMNAQEALLKEKFLEIKYAYEKRRAAIMLIKALGGGYYNVEGE